ncbi:MAG TPA: sodium:solute symporter family protein [Tepidisphaeraceae bacterium]|jgi:Na+/proline symporter
MGEWYIDIFVIAIYLIATLGVGVYQARKIRNTGDYYAGGRKFNKFYMMMHALGSASHADEPVSVIGGAYAKGISGIWYTYLFLPLTPIFWLLAPYIRRSRFLTVADFFRARYDESLAGLYSVMGVLKMSVAMGVVLKGTATIVHSITNGAFNESWTIYAMTVVFVIYGFAGGLRATVVTEAIQGPLIVIMSLLLLPFGLHAAGGFAALHHVLPASAFALTVSGHEFTGKWVMAMSLTALVGFLAQPGLLADFASGKTEFEGRVGYTYGTVIKRFCAMGWVFTGIVLAGLVAQGHVTQTQTAALANGREYAFGTAMRYLLPHGMLGLMFAAIFSAQMATLSSQMVNGSALASRNIYLAFIRPQASDREVLAIGRIAGIFLVAIGVFLAKSLADVANALTMLLQFASIMGVVMWGGVLWRRTNSAGAWAGVAVLFVVWAIFGPIGMLGRTDLGIHAAWLGIYGREQYVYELMLCYLPAGVAVMVLVSLFTPAPPRKQVDDFFLLIKTPVGQEQKLIDAGVPIVYMGNTQANHWEEKHPRLVHWGGFALAAIVCVGILGILKFLTVVQ